MSSHGCLIGIWLEIAFDCGLGLCGIFIIVIFVLDFNGTGMDLSIWVSGCQAWLYGELSVFGGHNVGVLSRMFGGVGGRGRVAVWVILMVAKGLLSFGSHYAVVGGRPSGRGGGCWCGARLWVQSDIFVITVLTSRNKACQCSSQTAPASVIGKFWYLFLLYLLSVYGGCHSVQ